MPITITQRASIGRWYIEEIQRRITVRKSTADKSKDDAESTRGAVISRHAEKFAKAHRLGVVAACHVESQRNNRTGCWESHLTVIDADGLSIRVPVSALPTLAAALKATETPQAVAKQCCAEVEFLTNQIKNKGVAGFQSYVSKLHAGPVDPREAELRSHLDSYLTACRPSVCKL